MEPLVLLRRNILRRNNFSEAITEFPLLLRRRTDKFFSGFCTLVSHLYPMSKERIELGKRGEGIATRYLEDKGYKILEINYKSRLGEIDIVAQEDKTICFIEVRTRKSEIKGSPQESVTQGKQHQLSKVALTFLKSRSLLSSTRCRFDVVSILLNEDKTPEKITLIKNAFYLNERYVY